MIKKPNNANGNAHRVITFLTRDELDFVDKIGKDALFSAGTRLSRSKIISAIVNVIRKIGIDGAGLRCKKDLEDRVIKATKNSSKAIYDKPRSKSRHKAEQTPTASYFGRGKSRKKVQNQEKKGEENESTF